MTRNKGFFWRYYAQKRLKMDQQLENYVYKNVNGKKAT